MLKIDQVKASYGSDEVLKGLSLNADEGAIHGILGVNGAGKTTLFKLLCGWLPLIAGEVQFKNRTLGPKDISFLETDPYFYPYMKGQEYLQILRKKNQQYDISKWNSIFELPLDQLADEYSTGMKKKLALLGLLAQNRPILIMDEPLSGVDVESNVKFQEIIKKLKETGKVILLSSHMLDSLISISDKISLLMDGVIVKTYNKEEFPALEHLVKSTIKSSINETLGDLMGGKAGEAG